LQDSESDSDFEYYELRGNFYVDKRVGEEVDTAKDLTTMVCLLYAILTVFIQLTLFNISSFSQCDD